MCIIIFNKGEGNSCMRSWLNKTIDIKLIRLYTVKNVQTNILSISMHIYMYLYVFVKLEMVWYKKKLLFENSFTID